VQRKWYKGIRLDGKGGKNGKRGRGNELGVLPIKEKSYKSMTNGHFPVRYKNLQVTKKTDNYGKKKIWRKGKRAERRLGVGEKNNRQKIVSGATLDQYFRFLLSEKPRTLGKGIFNVTKGGLRETKKKGRPEMSSIEITNPGRHLYDKKKGKKKGKGG